MMEIIVLKIVDLRVNKFKVRIGDQEGSSMIEQMIFSNLVYREPFVRRVIPYLKSEYFHSESDKVLFDLISGYINQYNKPPTPETLRIELDAKKLNEKTYEGVSKSISSLGD
jgi:replicative DNA helicase